MTLLRDLTAYAHAQSAWLERRLPYAQLEKLALAMPPPRSLSAALSGGPPAIIAELKRASPSRGVLRSDFDAVALAGAYAQGGARALSVLTNTRYFWGEPSLLESTAQAAGLPVLRKDFLVTRYQLAESRWYGADAVLLIARVLEGASLAELTRAAQGFGMEVLIELHTVEDARRVRALENVLFGVNQRDLDTLSIDTGRAATLAPQLPSGALWVAESGIETRAQVRALVEVGYQAFLVGHHLVGAVDPAQALRELCA